MMFHRTQPDHPAPGSPQHAGPLGISERPRRVREQAREAMAVMAFSALTSVAVAVALLIISRLGQQG